MKAGRPDCLGRVVAEGAPAPYTTIGKPFTLGTFSKVASTILMEPNCLRAARFLTSAKTSARAAAMTRSSSPVLDT